MGEKTLRYFYYLLNPNRCNVAEKRLESADRQIIILTEKLSLVQKNRDEIYFAMEEKEKKISNMMGKLQAKNEQNTENDAHVWWSYIWHEMRR